MFPVTKLSSRVAFFPASAEAVGWCPAPQQTRARVCAPAGAKYFLCRYEDCEKRFLKKGPWTVHERRHTGEKPFVCSWEGCGYASAQAGHLTQHLSVHTGRKPFVCPHEGCGRSFAQACDMKKHGRIHSGEQPFVCPHKGCGQRFSRSGNLKNHQLLHSDERRFFCPYNGCDHVFAQPVSLTRHKRIHTAETPFVCPHEGCGYSSPQPYCLRKHMRVHAGRKTLVFPRQDCLAGKTPVCSQGRVERRLVYQSDGIVHQRRARKEKPFVCSYEGCGYGGARFGDLRKHLRVHTRDRPFVCPYEGCGYASTQSWDLKVHLRVHTREKFFACSHAGCRRRFRWSSSLKKHLRTHTRGKKFLCSHEGCRRVFTRQDFLKRHGYLHTGDKPFVCRQENCSKRFTGKKSLIVHRCTPGGKKTFSCCHEGCEYAFRILNDLKKHWHCHRVQQPSFVVEQAPANMSVSSVTPREPPPTPRDSSPDGARTTADLRPQADTQSLSCLATGVGVPADLTHPRVRVCGGSLYPTTPAASTGHLFPDRHVMSSARTQALVSAEDRRSPPRSRAAQQVPQPSGFTREAVTGDWWTQLCDQYVFWPLPLAGSTGAADGDGCASPLSAEDKAFWQELISSVAAGTGQAEL